MWDSESPHYNRSKHPVGRPSSAFFGADHVSSRRETRHPLMMMMMIMRESFRTYSLPRRSLPRVQRWGLSCFFFGDARAWMMSVSLSRSNSLKCGCCRMACAVEEGTGRSFERRVSRSGVISEGATSDSLEIRDVRSGDASEGTERSVSET